MSWIAIAGQERSWVCPKTFSQPNSHLMPRGSIMIETRLSPDGRPQTLLSYQRQHPWVGSISFRAVPGGGIVLVMTQGSEVFHTVLQHDYDARADVLRITFVWDSERRFGRVALEKPDSDVVMLQDTPPPPPMLTEDIHTLARRPQLIEKDPDVVFFAVSDSVEPVGPMPTLSAQVPVLTSQGYRRIGDLQCGDLVQTRTSGQVPVLQRVSRRLPAFGSFRPVRLRAPYFGLERDMVVSPQQRLVIGGSEVEYIFGRQAVLIPAHSLVNGFAAVHEDNHMTVRYHNLLLPGHEPVIACGAEVESLYIGRLRRRKEMLEQSILANCPKSLLPEHARAGLQTLKSFEAIILAEARAA
ncbi:Hint domain-containing protein [Thalassococcus lentus]|uniref:Hint domain-containing protein n=1 Tax=Thalassococcus lentus TaxID=1210524 RepID=A0ABT4XPA9_9RHOB|nr:Hint domain-containing protein [Thalassococcus lentus]MDA7423784.1 Hint domain-containing protein [Thalassococcus lentus]